MRPRDLTEKEVTAFGSEVILTDRIFLFHLAAENGHFPLMKTLMKRFPNTDLFQEGMKT